MIKNFDEFITEGQVLEQEAYRIQLSDLSNEDLEKAKKECPKLLQTNINLSLAYVSYEDIDTNSIFVYIPYKGKYTLSAKKSIKSYKTLSENDLEFVNLQGYNKALPTSIAEREQVIKLTCIVFNSML